MIDFILSLSQNYIYIFMSIGLFITISIYTKPKRKYNTLVLKTKHDGNFYHRLDRGQKTTSHANAVNAYRQLIETKVLKSPQATNELLASIYQDFSNRYPKRFKHITPTQVANDRVFTLVLHTANAKNLHRFTWNQIVSFNPELERSLMTSSLRREILVRDNYRCRHCGFTSHNAKGLHIDHVYPVARGGRTVSSNLQVLCAPCNLSKGKKVVFS